MNALLDDKTARALEDLCRTAASRLGCTRASAWVFDRDHAAITCLCVYDTWQDSVSAGMRLLRADHAAYFDAMLRDLRVLAPQARSHPATRSFTAAYFEPLDIHSMVDVVVTAEGVPVGILCCEHSGEPRAWSAQDVAAMQGLAGGVAELMKAARG